MDDVKTVGSGAGFPNRVHPVVDAACLTPATIGGTRHQPSPQGTAIDRSFDSGNMAPGATWRYTFTKPGTYQFFCVVHPFMKGVVIVKEGK